MRQNLEYQFARLHFDYGLTNSDLANVYLMPLDEASDLLSRAKLREQRFAQRLAASVRNEPGGARANS